MKQKIISVFGSSSPKPHTPIYELAAEVGERLAKAGFAVATGGYVGTMEAVSRGANEAGGRVIGVTSERIEQYRPIGPNQWVQEEVRYATLRERLIHLVQHNDGMLVLPGGIGTLAELAMAWNGLQTGELSPRPFVLLGSEWKATMDTFIMHQADHIKPRYVDLLSFVTTPAEAVAAIQEGMLQSAS